ncbi:MAG: GIY-YIG nuclease family protein [Hyphomicrobium sp.]|nr:GIY-YIG nuclease family protein [Hyphomicrobium sp.]
MKSYWVYILASAPRGTLYVGVTNGLIRRIDEHRAGTASIFTRRYKVTLLVWFQEFADVREAIQREKTIKDWRRDWKVNLIERENPNWVDLYPTLPGVSPNAQL